MAAIKTAAQTIQRWQQGMQGAQQSYINGTAAVTESPMAKAAQQGPKAIQNYTAVINSGAWANALNNVSLQSWKDQCRIGAAKFAMGAQKGLAKYTRFANLAPSVWQAMRDAARQAGGTPQNKAAAALTVLINAGRKSGGNLFAR